MGVAAGDARQVIAVEMQGHGRTSECVSATGPADAQEWVTSVADLHFYSSFWMNLHHQLHADARDKNQVDASGWSSDDRAARSRALEVQP